MDLFAYTARELHQKLIDKEITAVEIIKSVHDRIDQVEGQVKSYITQTRETAIAQAAAVDAKLARGEALTLLSGIPGIIKDNLCTKGVKTTCASHILERFVPPYDATVVEKLTANDLVMTGKANMDEFAMGGSTENSGFFPTRNPWNLDCVPGGSSGGSAAAVAAGEAETGKQPPGCFFMIIMQSVGRAQNNSDDSFQDTDKTSIIKHRKRR
jgi:aspartyl-tRNA(Asn)/glutamyl-tRNA(Gln) amidotransferase subunit A